MCVDLARRLSCSVRLSGFHAIDYTAGVADVIVNDSLLLSDVLYQRFEENEVGRIILPDLGQPRPSRASDVLRGSYRLVDMFKGTVTKQIALEMHVRLVRESEGFESCSRQQYSSEEVAEGRSNG